MSVNSVDSGVETVFTQGMTTNEISHACEQHGPMTQRDLSSATPEVRACGVWWDCRSCGASSLDPSPDLQAQLAEQRDALDRERVRLQARPLVKRRGAGGWALYDRGTDRRVWPKDQGRWVSAKSATKKLVEIAEGQR